MNDEQKVIKGLQCCQNIDVICMDIHCFEPGFSECPYHGQDNCVSELCKDTLKLLQKQKRVGMPKQEAVVRCKDCVECYFASNRIQSEQTFACGKHGIDVTPDWFCADGERK